MGPGRHTLRSISDPVYPISDTHVVCSRDYRARRHTANISIIICRTIYLSSSNSNILRCVTGDWLIAGDNVDIVRSS